MQKLIVIFAVFSLLQRIILAQPTTKTISNCLKLSLDKKYCEYCEKDFYLDQFQLQCIKKEAQDRNCIQKYDKICVRCDCGYLIIQDKNTCARATFEHRGCEVINPNGDCIRPKKEFVLQRFGSSIYIRYSKGLNCEFETDNNICLQCHSGYKLDQNRLCVFVNKQIDNIYYSYFYGDQLKSRSSLYVPGNFGVYPIIKYCNEHTGKGDGKTAICTKCFDGMIPNQSRTNCYVSPCDFCKYANEELDQETKKIVIKCAECENNDYFYVNNITQINGSQVEKVQTCTARTNHLFDNCINRNPQFDKCDDCVASFVRNGNSPYCQLNFWKQITYKQRSTILFGCREMQKENECQECSKNFLLTSKKQCVKIPSQECIGLDNTDVCNQCLSLFYPKNNKCEIISQFQNCLKSDGKANMCTKCESKYFITQNSVSETICKEIQFPQNCSFSDGIEDKCAICNNLYYLNGKECKQVTDFNKCVVSDGKSDKCIYCIKDFQLDSGSCKGPKINSGCPPGMYELQPGGNCEIYTFQNKEQCLLFEKTKNQCQQCINQYYLNSNECIKTTKNCYTNGKEDKCLVCESSAEYVKSDSTCTQSQNSCQTNKIIDICTTCVDSNSKQGYYKDGNCYTDDSRDLNCINFKTINSQINCNLCKSGYYPIINPTNSLQLCQQISNNFCQTSSGQSDSCILCLVGYYEPNCSQKQISKCLDTSQSFCTQCENGYYVNTNTGQCLPISNPNCEFSDGIKNLCITCQQEFNFIDFNYSNYCGFTFCKTPNTSTPQKGCAECQDKFYLTKNGQCRPVIIDDCLEQISEIECSKCKDEFYLLQIRNGFVICQQIKQMIPNCKKGDGKDLACKECEDKYYISPNETCLTISSKTIDPLQDIMNCIKTDGKICTQCNDTKGYYLKLLNEQQICDQIRNCNKSNGIDLNCITCLDGFELKNGQCIIKNEILNCEIYNSDFTCKQCQSNYYLMQNSNPVCQKITDNQCQKSDGLANNCIEKNIYLQLSTDSPNCYITESTRKCLYCLKGYYIDQTNICTQITNIINDCILYNYNKDSNCIKCNPKQYYESPQCSSNIEGIEDCFFSNGSLKYCQNCRKMKFLKKIGSNYKCMNIGRANIKQGCLKYDFKEACEECVPNHFLSGTGGCFPRTLFDNCQEYEKDKDQCLKCNQDFVLVDDDKNHPFGIPYCKIVDREKIVLHCMEYKKEVNGGLELIKCTKCQNSNQYDDLTEYYLNQDLNRCIDITSLQCSIYDNDKKACKQVFIHNCKAYSEDGQTCSECKFGFYIDSTKKACTKYKTVNNCAQYEQSADKCQECENLYYLDGSGACIKITDVNCQKTELNKNKCILCNLDFSLDNNGACFLNSGSFCTKTQQNTVGSKCDQCNEFYTYDSENNKCIHQSLTVPLCKNVENKGYYRCAQNSCVDGYFYSKQNQCLPIESMCSIPNCEEYEETDSYIDYYYCKKCKGEFYVDQSSRCSYDPPEPYVDTDNLPDPIIKEESSTILELSIAFTLVIFLY